MANYYTYGSIPSMYLEEPFGEGALATAEAPGTVTTGNYPLGTLGNMFVPGFTAPAGFDLSKPVLSTLESQQAGTDFMRDLYLQQQKQAMALEPSLTSGYMGLGFLQGGLPITPEMRSITATPAQAPISPEGQITSITPEQTEQLRAGLQSIFQPEVPAAEAAAIQSNPRVQTLQKISDLLKSNNFAGAFQTALEAEKQIGGDFLDNLVNPDKMRMLRGPMTADEIRKFYEAIPQAEYSSRYVGPGNTYNVSQALERNLAALGGQSGYVDPRGGTKAKESIVSDIVDIAPYVFAATVAPHLFSTLMGTTAAAAAPYGLEAIPITATKIGATGALGAGAVGTTAAAALPEIVVTATKLGLTVPETIALLGATGTATSALTGGGAAASTAPLDQIVVQGTAPTTGSLANIIPALTAAQVAQMGTTPTSQIAQGYQPTEIPEDLAEVVVPGTKPSTLKLSDIIAPLTAAQVAQMGTTPSSEILKDYKPTDTRSTLEKFKDILGDAGKLNNFLKLAGLIGGGAAAAKQPAAGGLGAGAGGFGGALPKYQFQRTQLQPQVDYYRYGQGPEARFFEDKLVPVEPPAPPPAENAAIINPKDQPVFAEGGLAAGGRYVDGPGSGRDDKIPALLSDGEYVIDAETLALLGDGSPKEGAKRMDQFRANIRKHKGDALSRGRISPDAKSPSKYMGGGLT